MQRKMGKQQAFQLEENMPNKTRLMHLGPIEQKYEEASLRTAKVSAAAAANELKRERSRRKCGKT